MLKRVLYGLSVSLVVLLLLLFGNVWAFALAGIAVFVLAQHEFRLLARSAGIPMRRLTVPICGVAYLLATIAETPCFRAVYGNLVEQHVLDAVGVNPSEIILWLTPAVLLIVAIFRRNTERAFETFSAGLASFWYLAVLLGFLMRIAFEWNDIGTGRLAIIYTLLVIKMSDAGAYFIGMRFGRKGPRLIPEISPAKSVIGLGGGFLFGVVSSVLFALGVRVTSSSFPLTLGHAVVLGIVLTAAGCIGDLAESLFKRSVHVKDSASAVPGLGGILDMLDSPLFAAPIMYLYLRLFLLP